MTKQEEKVLKIIKDNPTIEQAEIARILGIKRSTVGVHISKLIKQGYITGKGYIINNNDYVVGIGAANVDVYGKSLIKIRTHYDHPAQIVSDVGGVTRNILNNLAKLNIDTKLITAVGNDSYGKMIIDDCVENNIDANNVVIVEDDYSSVFMQIQDENNDMYLAVCDMSILEAITPEYIRRKKNIILNSKLVLIDPSLRMDTIEEIIQICKDNIPIYVDPISDNYALKIKKHIGEFDTIKPNKSELECLSGIKINNDDDLYSACKKLIDKGVKKIFVSLGKDGILYVDNEENKIKKKLKPVKQMVNASGAGDACMAAVMYGTMNNLKIEKTIDYCLAAGIAAIQSNKAINKDLSINLLEKIIKEYKA